MDTQRFEIKLEVFSTKLDRLVADNKELRSDVKALLGFRAFVWGGAAAVSALVSFLLEAVRHLSASH